MNTHNWHDFVNLNFGCYKHKGGQNMRVQGEGKKILEVKTQNVNVS